MLLAGQADDARGAGQGHARPALPVERPDRPLAPQPGHRLHLLPVRPPLPEPRRAGTRSSPSAPTSPGPTRRASRSPRRPTSSTRRSTPSPSRPRSPASTGPAPTTATSRCRPTAASPGPTSPPHFYDMKTGKAKPGVKGALIPFDRWVKRVVPSPLRREHLLRRPSAATGPTTRTRPGSSSPATWARPGRTSPAA